MNINRPAEEVFTSLNKNTISDLKVLSQDGRVVTVLGPREDFIPIGGIILFDALVRGIITAINGSAYTVLLTADRQVSTATAQKTFSSFVNQPLRLNGEFGLGGLQVRCSYLSTHKPGFMGWTLYGPNNSVLAIGNDFAESLTCNLISQSLWLPGNYQLKVTAFDSTNLLPIANASTSWVVTKPVSILRKGNYDDSSAVLVLK
jgi:hypothetical protein